MGMSASQARLLIVETVPDTIHNALQTEYESVKNVISKNVERSFKAFS